MHVESMLYLYTNQFHWTVFKSLSNGLQWASVLHKKQCLLDPRLSLLCFVQCQIFVLEREMLSKHRDGMLGFAQNAHNWLSTLDEENRWIHECVFSSWLYICCRYSKPTVQIGADLISEDQNDCVQNEYLWPIMHNINSFWAVIQEIKTSNNKEIYLKASYSV